MRGNENNRHRSAGTDQDNGREYCNTGSCDFDGSDRSRPGRSFKEKGAVPGYGIFNLDTKFEVNWRFEVFAQDHHTSTPTARSKATAFMTAATAWANLPWGARAAPRAGSTRSAIRTVSIRCRTSKS